MDMSQYYVNRYAPYSVYDYSAVYGYPSAATVVPQMAMSQPVGTAPSTTTSAKANIRPYCLFIYNLPPNADESLLYRLFSPYGAIVNVRVIRDLSTGLCKVSRLRIL